MAEQIDFVNELKWRGFLKDCTDEEGLRTHLASGVRLGYGGFDPTADSLTIGNLMPIMMLKHWQRAGHKPVVVMGGGTGLIGDPSGKTAERQLNTPEIVAANVNAQRPIFESILGKSNDDKSSTEPVILNNLDWLGGISYIEALRDIGKHFSVNMMMQKDSVKSRLESREQGISYTEFSYMILQSYDYLHLYKEQGVTMQMGGSDQFGNIVAGTDLIRRVYTEDGVEETSHQTFGLTCHLVTKADGGKFGKTETGAVWLTAARTSPFAYYQFWLNAADADVGKFLRFFTLLTQDEIEAIEAEQAENPGARPAQRALARNATALLHGEAAVQSAEEAAKALFSGQIAGLDEATLREVLAEVPSSDHAIAALEGDGMDPVELLVTTKLAQSNRQAREFLTAGSVSINGEKIGPEDRLRTSHLLHGSMIAIRRGKKNWYLTRWA